MNEGFGVVYVRVTLGDNPVDCLIHLGIFYLVVTAVRWTILVPQYLPLAPGHYSPTDNFVRSFEHLSSLFSEPL